jgi:Fms-interacting protein/Thoc5
MGMTFCGFQCSVTFIQAEVSKKREHVSGFQELVPEITKRAKAAFNEVGLSSKLPAVERVSGEWLPTPLYVIYSNFRHLNAAFGTDLQVRIFTSWDLSSDRHCCAILTM